MIKTKGILKMKKRKFAKSLLVLALSVLFVCCLTACTNEKASANSEIIATSNNVEKEEKVSTPTFAGDTAKFFKLNWKDALNLSGNGATTNSSQYIFNKNNNLEIYLTNSADNLTEYYVNKIAFDSKSKNLSFYGVSIGDTLKSADKTLMAKESIYKGNLTWVFSTDTEEYTVKLTSVDDKTVNSVEVSLMIYSEYYPKPKKVTNPYTYTEDMHDLEPLYWE